MAAEQRAIVFDFIRTMSVVRRPYINPRTLPYNEMLASPYHSPKFRQLALSDNLEETISNQRKIAETSPWRLVVKKPIDVPKHSIPESNPENGSALKSSLSTETFNPPKTNIGRTELTNHGRRVRPHFIVPQDFEPIEVDSIADTKGYAPLRFPLPKSISRFIDNPGPTIVSGDPSTKVMGWRVEVKGRSGQRTSKTKSQIGKLGFNEHSEIKTDFAHGYYTTAKFGAAGVKAWVSYE